jgi:hypothetical protein
MVVRTSALPALLMPWSRDRSPLAVEHLPRQHGRDLGTDPAQRHQLGDGGVTGRDRVALRLDRGQLGQDQPEPFDLP